MTEETEENCDDREQLLHLTDVSFIPAHVVSVWWDMNQEFSKKIVTRVRTRFDIFVLESDSPCYKEDMEALKKATGKK
jgi:hypothetical protein